MMGLLQPMGSGGMVPQEHLDFYIFPGSILVHSDSILAHKYIY